MASQFPPKRTCSKCKAELPASLEFFDRCNRVKIGLLSYCKKCRAADMRARYQRKHPLIIRDAAWREKIRANARARSKRWADKNRERLAIKRRENREQQRAYMARYYPAHREMFIAKTAAWVKAHPERVKAHGNTRRARMLGNGGHHTDRDIRNQYLSQNGRCFYCGIDVGNGYHVDHVVPLSRGGSNSPENIVIACEPCNRSKHARSVEDFIRVGRGIAVSA